MATPPELQPSAHRSPPSPEVLEEKVVKFAPENPPPRTASSRSAGNASTRRAATRPRD